MVTLHAFVKPSANALRQHAVGGIVRETAMIVQKYILRQGDHRLRWLVMMSTTITDYLSVKWLSEFKVVFKKGDLVGRKNNLQRRTVFIISGWKESAIS